MRRVVVTGLGLVSPIGQTVAGFFDALAAARSGIACVAPELCPGTSSLVAGRVDFDATAHWAPHQLSQLDRATQFALFAARSAIADASLQLGDDASRAAGVYWGTGLGGATSIEDSYRELYAGRGRVRPTSVVLAMNNAAAGQISIANGLRGPLLNVSTACSSSAAAIGEAYRAIKHGFADTVIAGGSEALITNGNLRAWDAMQALAHADPADPSRSCKPFSKNRTGIVLGEGAAALVLEDEAHALARGAAILAELAGYGNAADASHISKPDADGQVRAMRAALADAGASPSDVGYLNAHGTATAVGDAVETGAIKQVFGDHAAKLPISSTKALHGHLMGATGAVELLAALSVIARGVLPPTAHLEERDPVCDLDYVPNVARAGTADVVMSNSFGFGGMNAVLVARRYQQ
ncbi:MAG TPA: beta-ketoacyl-[acyl-carrier-protein] synthase family protein [Gemmatimonadaceae bacterium]|nr:beta-ketoacyl-[acyl-carrier-protein] synthase family protein [Gemmatimonadaceae bacterium]